MSLYLCCISETITTVKVEDNPSELYFQVRIVNVCVEFGFFFFQNLKLNIQKTKIMPSGPNTSWQINGKTVETVAEFIFWGGAPKSLQMDTAAMKLKDAYSLEGKLWPT